MVTRCCAKRVERGVGALLRFDATLADGSLRGGGFDQFQAVARNQGYPRRPSWRVTGAAGALQQASDSLRRTDLQYALDGQEIDAEVEAGGAHDRLQRAGFQAVLDPIARGAFQRAVVQGDESGPIGPGVEQLLVPNLGLTAGVGEHEGGGRAFDLGDHPSQHGDAEIAAPGNALGLLWQQRVDDQRFVELSAHEDAFAARADQRAQGAVEIAERRREAPDACVRAPASEPRQRQLGLHAALVADEFVPFVDDDHVERGEARLRLGMGEHQG